MDLLAKARAETRPSLGINFETSTISFDNFFVEALDLAPPLSETLACPVPLFGNKRVNPKSKVITMACQHNRREGVDEAADDNDGKEYDDDVKRLC